MKLEVLTEEQRNLIENATKVMLIGPGGTLYELLSSLTDQLSAERTRRLKAEEVVDWELDPNPDSEAQAYAAAEKYRAQYPRVETKKESVVTETAPKSCPFCGGTDNEVMGADYGLVLVHAHSSIKDTDCPMRGMNIPTALWNRRPNPETQAMATVSKVSGAFRIEWYGDFKNLQDGEKLYRSPVESVPVAEIEGICAQIHKLRTDGFVNHGSYADKELEAIETRLSAIVKEQK